MRFRFSLVSPSGSVVDVDVGGDASLSIGEVCDALGSGLSLTCEGRILRRGERFGSVVANGSILQVSAAKDGALARCDAGLEETPSKGGGLFGGVGLLARAPRLLPALVDSPVDPPSVPDPPLSVSRLSVSMLLVPLIVGGLLVFVFGPLMAVFALLSPLMVGGSWVEDKVKKRRWIKRARAAVAEQLPEFNAALEAQVSVRREREAWFSPDTKGLDERCENGLGLWERRPGDPDFLSITFGTSDVEVGPVLSVDPGSLFNDIVVAAQAFDGIEQSGVRLGWLAGTVVGLVGDATAVAAWVRRVLCEALVLHGPADLSVAVLGGVGGLADSVRWVPHASLDAVSGRILVADSEADADSCVRALMQDDSGRAKLVIAEAGLVAGRVEAGLRDLVAATQTNTTLIVVSQGRDGLLELCDPIVSVGPGGEVAVERRRALPLAAFEVETHSEPSSPDQVGSTAGRCELVTAARFDRICRRLAGWRDPLIPSRSSELPASVALADLIDTELTPEAVAQLWSQNRFNAPTAVLGAGTSELVELSLVEDGPHGLAGGTTGSGKSELLRTLVMSLALRHSPSDVNFVLVDYKGGAAFDLCAGLAHVAGLVTDLDGRLAERALASLRAELERRERMLRPFEVENIDQYWALNSRHDDMTALPRLFVVIDEFALLANELPNFIDALVEVAQVGRSLGVHMLLATQRPAGVVKDNIRANTNYRVALRTQRDTDSDDIIGCGEAARLPRAIPGRGLMKLGGDDLIEFQTASVSLATIGKTSRQVEIRLFDTAHIPDTRTLVAAAESACSNVGERSDAEIISEAIEGAVNLSGLGRARPVWADLVDQGSTQLGSLSDIDLCHRGEQWRLGIADDPEHQQTVPWVWQPAADGNLVAYGTTNSGVSNLAVTAAALAQTAPLPWEVQAFDFTDSGLAQTVDWSRVGTVTETGDRERVCRLIGYLIDQIDSRRQHPSTSHPNLLVIVDGFAGLKAQFESPADYVFIDAVARIVRDGPAQRIYTLITASQPAVIPSAIASTITNRAAYNLADAADYAAIGLRPATMNTISTGQNINLATGLYTQTHTITDTLAAVLANIEHSIEPTPTTIGVLPQAVKLAPLIGQCRLDDHMWEIPIGVSNDTLHTLTAELDIHEHLIVAGTAKSGRTTTLESLAAAIAHYREPPPILVLAPKRSHLHELTYTINHTELGPYQTTLSGLLEDEPSRPIAAIIDDAVRIDPENHLQHLLEHPNLHVFAAERSDLLRNAYGHWTRELRQTGTGIICRPQPETDNDLFAVRVPKHDHAPHRQLSCYITNGTATIFAPATP